MANSAQLATTYNSVNDFIKSAGILEKRASYKAAGEPLSEPGSQGGETEHPVRTIDDNMHTAPEGFRFDENTRDVNEDQGAPGVQKAPEATHGSGLKAAAHDLSRFARPRNKYANERTGTPINQPGSAEEDQYNLGLRAAPTGDDPSVETSSAKAGKEDGQYHGPSAHPARTDNEALDDHKYAGDLYRLPIPHLQKLSADLGNALCERFAREIPGYAQQTQKYASDGYAMSDAQVAQQAGWEAAGVAMQDFDKMSVDAAVHQRIAGTIKIATDLADDVADFLDVFYQTQKEAYEKLAEGEEMGSDPSMMMPPPDGGGVPMGGEGGGEEMLGDGMGEGDMGGGDEAMMSALGGHGEPDGDEGGEGAEGLSEEIEELLARAEEADVSPEELEAMVHNAQQGDEGGDMDDDMGEGGEGESPLAAELGAKMSNDRGGRRPRKGHQKEAMIDQLRELLLRSDLKARGRR